ncbi:MULTISPECIES: hypothetical protein [Kitasatospora]|uniref:hypothetical protein n=1 Tax=Kitasatospora TaxID=2063 RepID=UPI000C714B00|nr:hypothetical protein [Kitasatospora sp. GP30]MDH6138685.1 hypothetical protein [Kitasatospora sp. GP30]
MHEWDVEDGRERDGERLSEALNRAVGGVEPDLGPMVAAAAAQGRSLRRRRAGAAGAVAAVLALTVGVGAVQLAGGSGQRADGTVVSVAAERFIHHSSSLDPMVEAPTLTADQLTAAARSPEVQAWVAPDFAARAATTFQSFTNVTSGGLN